MSKTIQQSVIIKAPPRVVYETLMDSRKHSQFTKAKANISRQVGGKFTAYGPHLSGFTLELVANKKIVQAWRAQDWPKGHYSIATFTLTPVKGGTRLTFNQIGVPDKHYRGINQGWKDSYWKPMKKMLEKSEGLAADLLH